MKLLLQNRCLPKKVSILHSKLCHIKLCFYQFVLVVASYVYFSSQKKCRSPGKPKKLKQSLKLIGFLTNKCFVFNASKQTYFAGSVGDQTTVGDETTPKDFRCVIVEGGKNIAFLTKIQC